ncbi:hypothetical protein V9T40_009004 [Parthenolecanium corni]|uniref:LRRCT domain-containing protein n=1 Tax=Parthenolecanium corni TaxID=536013 RepID=A0AAN9Y6E2_9HEMI
MGLLLTAVMLQTGWSQSYWRDKCIPQCHCKYVDGRKQADCQRNGMTDIPTELSDEIQVLLLNDNYIRELKSKIFFKAGLVNLQKINLRNCSIEDVDQHAFAGLDVLTHIDLSVNQIKRLDPSTFQLPSLRYLHINNNSIQRLENNLLANLPQLQVVEFNFNRISDIGDRTFFNLSKLKMLKFKNNQLVQLQPSLFQSIGNIAKLSFDLQDNPWKCDCQLREFFDFVKSNSFSTPTYCHEPEYLEKKSWESLTKEQFVCLHTEEEIADEKVTPSSQLSNHPNSKLNSTFNEIKVNVKIFSDNINDGNKITKDQESIIAPILKQLLEQTLDEKLALIINQNELLQKKVKQLEVKIDHLESYIPLKNADRASLQSDKIKT